MANINNVNAPTKVPCGGFVLGEGLALGEDGKTLNVTGGGSQADWNQNDSTAADYVKNRPFYTGDTVEKMLLDETSLSISISYGSSYCVSQTIPVDFNFETGNTYKITWDGTVYECVAYKFGGNSVIGSKSIVQGEDPTDEPFFIRIETTPEEGLVVYVPGLINHTISISSFVTEIVKIDEKYIPELTPYMTKTNPSGKGSFSLNRRADTTIGEKSFASGNNTTASGGSSHAEGMDTTASGVYSHAEGYYTTASGGSSHAEGSNTTASGGRSHAEGYYTAASGDYSHAEGYYTKASGNHQHVQGKYNVEDTGNYYADIVGNGVGIGTRSNAYTLDWKGNGWFAGTVKIGGTSYYDSNAKELVSKEYVDKKLPSVASSDSGKFLRVGEDGMIAPSDLIVPSSTNGSTKKFKITVDDNGTISATEVTA